MVKYTFRFEVASTKDLGGSNFIHGGHMLLCSPAIAHERISTSSQDVGSQVELFYSVQASIRNLHLSLPLTTLLASTVTTAQR